MKNKFWKGFWVGVLSCIVASIIGSIGFYIYAEYLVTKRLKAPQVPTELKENYNFKYTTLNGEDRYVASLKGKVVFVNFWGTWCLPCVAEMPTIQKLYDHFKEDTSVVFLLPSRLDAPDKIQSFTKKHHYTLPFYTMKDEDIPLAMRFNQYPATFIYAKDGSIAMKHINGADWADPTVIAFIKKLKDQ